MKQTLKYFLVSILSVLIGVLSTLFIKENIKQEDTLKESIKTVYDSVVSIEAFNNGELVSNGSGFIYKKSDKAYIITNNHVIEKSDSIKIINSAGIEIEGEVINSDIYKDIAIITMDKKYATTIASFGDSDKLELGDRVFTIGTPVNEKYLNTITTGIVSGLNRKVRVTLSNGNFLINAIQTDAPINPGNSGGPLVNIEGKVVGINTMKVSEENVEGIGFSIPINDVKEIISELEKGKKIERPTIGLELINIDNTSKLNENYIALDKSITYGVVVTDVYDNTPAYNGGLKLGDVIIKLDDNKINNMSEFKYYFYKYSIGDKVKVQYIREGKINTTIIDL